MNQPVCGSIETFYHLRLLLNSSANIQHCEADVKYLNIYFFHNLWKHPPSGLSARFDMLRFTHSHIHRGEGYVNGVNE